MKMYAVAAVAVLALTGCTSTTISSKSAYDLTEVCLTDEGKPASKGTTYKGKTCSAPDTSVVYPKPNLVWS